MSNSKVTVRVAVGAALLAIGVGCGGSGDEVGEAVAGSEWARFRGADGLGISTESDLPTYWDQDGSGVRWTVEIPGPGVSSPIVHGQRVFLTAESPAGEELDLKVLAFDLATGEEIWETTVFRRAPEDFPVRSVNNSSSGPSPATDGERIYAYFGTHLAALDLDGELQWIRVVDPDYLDTAYYGAGSSVVLAPGNRLILFRDREKVEEDVFGWLAVFDRASGERFWRKRWTDTCCSYTTPILYEGASGTEILVSQAGRMASYDLETGKRLWIRPQEVNQPVASPVLDGDLLCSASGGHGVKNLTCWNLRANDKGNTRPEPLWGTKRGISSIVSPVLYEGVLYTLSDEGVLFSFDPNTGHNHWTRRLQRGAYSASLIAGDGKVYAFSRWGAASVVAADREYQLLAENTLPHPDVVATPAIAGGCLVVRSKEHLMCIEGADAPPPAEEAAPDAAAAG